MYFKNTYSAEALNLTKSSTQWLYKNSIALNSYYHLSCYKQLSLHSENIQNTIYRFSHIYWCHCLSAPAFSNWKCRFKYALVVLKWTLLSNFLRSVNSSYAKKRECVPKILRFKVNYALHSSDISSMHAYCLMD